MIDTTPFSYNTSTQPSFLSNFSYLTFLYVPFLKQIESGAQILQIFESWAHQLSEEQFVAFAKPYADEVARYLKARHPTVPVVYFANGGSVYLHQQLDMGVDGLSIGETSLC
jgi:uroporphyrinogen-III decarboxylase